MANKVEYYKTLLEKMRKLIDSAKVYETNTENDSKSYNLYNPTVEKDESLLIYDILSSENEKEPGKVTYRINLLNKKEKGQLEDYLSLIGLEWNASIKDALNNNAVPVLLTGIAKTTIDIFDLFIGSTSTETLASRMQRETDYVRYLLSDQNTYMNTQELNNILYADNFEDAWNAKMNEYKSAPLRDKKRILNILIDNSNSYDAWRNHLTNLIYAGVRDRLIDGSGEKNPDYLKYFHRSPEFINEKEQFEQAYNATKDQMMLETIEILDFGDDYNGKLLKKYFDKYHSDYRVAYPEHQSDVIPTHDVSYEYATPGDVGTIEKSTTLGSVVYRYVQPTVAPVKSDNFGHMLEDKLRFAECVLRSVGTLAIDLVSLPLSTLPFGKFSRKEFRGFLDLNSNEFFDVVTLIAKNKQDVLKSYTPAHIALGESDRFVDIQKAANDVYSNMLDSGFPQKYDGNDLPVENRFIHDGNKALYISLLSFEEFLQLFESYSLLHEVYISRDSSAEDYKDDEVVEPTIIEGRYFAVHFQATIKPDIDIYFDYMRVLGGRLLEKEEGLLATFVQAIKVIETSIEMLLTTIFTGAKIGLKWLAPLLSVPLIASSPFILIVKYFADTFFHNYANSKPLLFIVFELLVLPLEILFKTVGSVGHVAIKTLQYAIVGIRGQIRMLWNDAVKELVVMLIEIDGGSPNRNNFMFSIQTVKGVPQYGTTHYHIGIETSKYLVLSQLYTSKYREELDNNRNGVENALHLLNKALESTDAIQTILDMDIFNDYDNTLLTGESVKMVASRRSPGDIVKEPAHEEFCRQHAYGALDLDPELDVDCVLNELPSGISITDQEILAAIEAIRSALGTSGITQTLQSIVFNSVEAQQYDPYVSNDTNASLRIHVSDLFLSEMTYAIENALQL